MSSRSARLRRTSPLGLALCAATLASACSIVLVRPTPRRLECNSYLWPAFDLAAAPLVAMFALGKRIENSELREESATPALLAGAALLTLFSSGYGGAAIAECRARARALAMEEERAATAKEAREEADVARHRREQKAAAWALTERAKAAARGGDCATVEAFDAQVLGLDPALHATVFVGDVAIAACLTDPTAPLP